MNVAIGGESGWDWTQISASIVAATGAIGVSVVGFFAGRRKSAAEAAAATTKAKTDIQTSLNDGFAHLVGELQEERKALMGIIRSQSDKIEALSREVHQMRYLLETHGIAIPS